MLNQEQVQFIKDDIARELKLPENPHKYKDMFRAAEATVEWFGGNRLDLVVEIPENKPNTLNILYKEEKLGNIPFDPWFLPYLSSK